MKRGTEAKVKFKKLERALKLQTWQVKGLLQSLWDFAAAEAPAGDIGRFTDDEIAIGIGCTEDIAPILAALVEMEWLDEHPEHRLIVHHWPQHCENSVHACLARRRILFADGSVPKLTKLEKPERVATEKILKKAAKEAAESGSRKPPEDAGGCLEQTKSTPTGTGTGTLAFTNTGTRPLPAGAGKKPVAGVFANVTKETLQDDAQLQAWYEHATSQRKPVVKASDQNRLRVFASAERALAESENPPRLFAWMVSGENWGFITGEQEDRAQARIRAMSRAPPPNGEVASLVSGLADHFARKTQ